MRYNCVVFTKKKKKQYTSNTLQLCVYLIGCTYHFYRVVRKIRNEILLNQELDANNKLLLSKSITRYIQRVSKNFNCINIYMVMTYQLICHYQTFVLPSEYVVISAWYKL